MGGMSNSNIFCHLRANYRDYLAMKRNRIPFAFLVAIMKPFRKIFQGISQVQRLINWFLK